MSQPPQQHVPEQQRQQGPGQQPTRQFQQSGQFQQPGQSGQVQQSGQGGRTQGTGGTQLYPTRNYLPEEVRTASIATLDQVLVDTVDLLTQVRTAHWNVRGPNFIGLHELFEEIAEDLEAHTDLVAERATALGGETSATARSAAAKSRIPDLPTSAIGDLEYVELVAERLAVHDANLAQAIRTAEQRDDLDTADLLNEVSREVSKNLWFLEAHLQTEPVSRMGQQGQGGQTGQTRQTGQKVQGQQQGGQFVQGTQSGQGSQFGGQQQGQQGKGFQGTQSRQVPPGTQQ